MDGLVALAFRSLPPASTSETSRRGSLNGRHLLCLPDELLLLTFRSLELRDLFHYCATCRRIRALLNLENLVWLIENFEDEKDKRKAVMKYGLDIILRSHALVLLCGSSRRVGSELNPLIRSGISFGLVPSGTLVERFFLAYGPSKKLFFLLRHGASIHHVPGGIDALLSRTWREANGWRIRIAFLIEHGASFSNVVGGVDSLLRVEYIQSGPTSRTNFLLNHGASLRKMGLALLEAGDKRWRRPSPAWLTMPFLIAVGAFEGYSQHDLNELLEQMLRAPNDNKYWKLLTERCGAEPSKVPCGVNNLLEDLFWLKGSCPKVQFLLGHGASFDQTPRGMDQLLSDTLLSKKSLADVYLLLAQGGIFENCPGGINQLLEDVYRQHGPSPKTRLLIEYGARLEHVPGGINRLLQDVYLTQVEERGRWSLFEEATHLLDHGASFAQTPRGLDSLLEVTIRKLGEVGNATKLLVKHGASLRAVPSGMDTLLCDVLQTEGQPQLVVWFLREGASLPEARLHALLSEVYLNEGPQDSFRYLVEERGASLHAVPGGIHALLERVLLRGHTNTDHSREEYLLAEGASFERGPSGPHVLLRRLQDHRKNRRYLHSQRPEQFLREHCAALRPVTQGLGDGQGT